MARIAACCCQAVLEARGYLVMVVDDAIAALASFAGRRSEIRVIVTDLMMLAVQGAELIRQIRALTEDLPIATGAWIVTTRLALNCAPRRQGIARYAALHLDGGSGGLVILGARGVRVNSRGGNALRRAVRAQGAVRRGSAE